MATERLAPILLALAWLAAAPLAAQDADDNDLLVRLAREAGQDVHWIADPYRQFDLFMRNPSTAQPRTPSVDRNVLLDSALARARAERRLVLVYVFRIAGGHMYRAPVLDNYMNLALFSDPELVELINRKFVPLRLYVDRQVGKRLGVINRGAADPRFLKTVEPALLFLDPDGKVLHVVQRIRTFSAHWLRHVLEEVLRAHSKYGEPSPVVRALASPGKRLEAVVYVARQRCLDGDEAGALEMLEAAAKRVKDELDAARARLKDVEAKKPGSEAEPSAVQSWNRRQRAAHYVLDRALTTHGEWIEGLAQALRLLRRGREALPGLTAALAEIRDPALRGRLGLEHARIRLALGEWDAVIRALEDAPAGSESEFLRGAACWSQWNLDAAREHFRQAVRLGEPPFHRRAAAVLAVSDDTTPMSPLAHGFTLLEYGPDSAYAPGVPATSEIVRKGKPAAAREPLARAALGFLLAQQRPDGSWADTRYAYWPAPRILPNVRVAVTALAASAILGWRDLDPARADAALARAEPYLADDGRVAAGTEEEVYAQAYRMYYWVTKAAVRPASRQEAIARLNALARRAGEIQQGETGLFMHEYYNAFCTGAMLWSLYLAREAGATVPKEVIERGVKALVSARREDGTFVYGGTYRSRSGSGSASKARNVTNLKNSMARMPHCEGVLFAFGASNAKKLEHAFEVFLEYLDRLERVRKCDFHSDGELGGFFFWHALFHAAEARRLMRGTVARKFDAALLDLVTGFPEIDGSFVDDHELGKCYGTAMGLLVLKSLGD
jgi:hypothetical protein